MISVYSGNNWFKIKQEIDLQIQKFLETNDRMNIERFNGLEADFNQIMGALTSVSLFTESKLVIIDTLSAQKKATENPGEFFSRIDDYTSLIVIEQTVDKRSIYYKYLKKLPGFKEFNQMDEASLAKWTIDYVSSKDGNIAPSDARYLVERVGVDQSNLENELIKLVQYNKQVTRDTIDLLTDELPTSTIFTLIETAFSGDLKKALQFYEEQRAMKVEPQAIFGMLVWQMHIVSVVSASKNKDISRLSSETGINSFVLGKAKRIADRLGKQGVIEFLDFMANIEKTSRSQTYDFDDAMRLAIVKLAN